ncbi:MAG: hypothetical protein WDM92_05760 [Caulobacteraceae bacterium]
MRVMDAGDWVAYGQLFATNGELMFQKYPLHRAGRDHRGHDQSVGAVARRAAPAANVRAPAPHDREHLHPRSTGTTRPTTWRGS